MSGGGRRAFVRMFSGAVLNQALLSAGNFLVGLILIRRTSDAQYGAYVLIMTTIMLLSPLQAAFIQPEMVARMTTYGRPERATLVGGLYRGNLRLALAVGSMGLAASLMLWLGGFVPEGTAAIVAGGAVAVAATLYREFFRMVLMSHRRPFDVLRGDFVYTAMLVAGAICATFTGFPATVAGLTLGLAAVCGSLFLARSLWRFEPWDVPGRAGLLGEMAERGTWAAVGCGIHWTFTQGYSYLIAVFASIAAVAGIAATRLVLMPVVILSTGVSALMLPTASMWLHQLGPRALMRRLALVCLGMAVVTVGYTGVVWLLRDWIFDVILKKHFADRDQVLLLWAAVFTVVAVRDHIIYLLLARGRFHILAWLAFGCAALALALSYVGLQLWGASGALVGMLAGELVNLTGVLMLSRIEMGRVIPEPAPATVAVGASS